MDILRIATAGSVDDGKSTLIGRLLYETKSITNTQEYFINTFKFISNNSVTRPENYIKLDDPPDVALTVEGWYDFFKIIFMLKIV